MKKLLALVLALVMTLGLATVAANAAFPDAADVDLTEAVDVMSAVGVFKGNEKGEFQPKANLDRASAAKLIAYLDLGEKSAEALPAVAAFNDVPASHWASKYIAYCANAGYLAGDGTGNFNPSAPLTGYAFGKMILCVLGYDPEVESFVGSNWSINVAKAMQKNDIAKGIDSAASEILTREQAAQYCFNGLKANTVEYDTKGTSIEINGAKIATGASKAEDVTVKASTTKNTYAAAIDGTLAAAEADFTVQLGEKLFDGDLKKVVGTASDAFGAPANEWKYKSVSVGTYPQAPDASYTGKLTKGTVYTLLGKDIVKDIEDGNAKLDVYIDGTKYAADETQAVKGSSAKFGANLDGLGANTLTGTDNGAVTEIYIDDDGVETPAGDKYAQVTAVVKNTYLMQATADYNSKTEKLTVKNLTGANNKTSLEAKDLPVEGFKKDDYILYTYSNMTGVKEVKSVAKATVLTGKVNSYVSGDSLTLDGTKYFYDAKALNDGTDHAKSVAFTVGDTAKVVLDAQNFIVYVDEAKVSNDDIVFVSDIGKSGFDYTARIVTVDGKKLTVTIDSDSTSDAAGNTKISGDGSAFKGNFWAYEIEDGAYKLSYYANKANTAAAATVKLNKVTNLVAGYTANSNTVYIIRNEDGDVKLYTGVKNAPDSVSFGTTTGSAYVAFNSDNDITYVYVDSGDKAGAGVEEASATDKDLTFVLRVKTTVNVDANKDKYTETEVLVNGEKKTLKVANGSAPFTAGKLYKSVKTNSKGFVTGATEVTYGGTNEYQTIDIDTATKNAFDYSDGVFKIMDNNDPQGVSFSRFIKTDKVYVYLAKNSGDLMDDTDANYEVAEISTFDELKNFVNGYKITATVDLVLGDDASKTDSEITSAYVWIKTSVDASK